MYPCDIAVWLQFPVFKLVFQYYYNGVNVERVRGPTVSLGAVGPQEFDLLTPAAQHNVLLWCYLLISPTSTKCGIFLGVVCTQVYTLHNAYMHTHTCVEHNIVNAVKEKCDVGS